jgi:hypothetical protein
MYVCMRERERERERASESERERESGSVRERSTGVLKLCGSTHIRHFTHTELISRTTV